MRTGDEDGDKPDNGDEDPPGQALRSDAPTHLAGRSWSECTLPSPSQAKPVAATMPGGVPRPA